MENYIVPKEKLIQLLANSEELQALQYGGVDNWDFYGEALRDYLDEAKEQYNLISNNKHISFYDVASAKLRSGDFRKEE
jgi:hypothetical protein